MKGLLLAMFVALLMAGCGPSQETLDFIRQTKESGATELDLVSKQISDLAPLAELTKLEQLHLDWNQITDVTPLAGLTNLTNLFLPENQITDVAPLAVLTNLEWLDLRGEEIPDDQKKMLEKALPDCIFKWPYQSRE